MKYKDIVNRQKVDLTNCEHEPIHIPGSIQPHGFLIGVTTHELLIEFCSGNIFEYIGLRHEKLLGKNFQLVFGEIQTNNLTTYISSPDNSSAGPLKIILAGKIFTCVIHTNINMYLLEFEPLTEENILLADIYHQTKQFTYYMQMATTLQVLCQSVADETRGITGYDIQV